MIDAAIADGKPEEVATIIAFARRTNPDETAALDRIESEYAALRDERQAERAAERKAEIRNAGLLDNWSGEGEIGALRATGNSDNIGVTVGFEVVRQGIDWRHKLTALADYQQTDGRTTREQLLVAYEPQYSLDDSIFLYGLGQLERDRFQGFANRLSLSGGVGYRLIETDDIQLSVKGGPAFRRTDFIDGGTQSRLAALAALDFDWQLAENIAFTQDANAFLQSGNSTFVSNTGLKAGLGGGLSARIAYAVEYDTNPPPGAVSVDTLSRFTLVYGF